MENVYCEILLTNTTDLLILFFSELFEVPSGYHADGDLYRDFRVLF